MFTRIRSKLVPSLSVGLFLCLFFLSSDAQTIFSYGPYNVGRSEFLAAFTRNNAEAVTSDKNYRDYLDLYIRFKLKVRAALDDKMDTSALQKEELANFKAQIIERYMTDEDAMSELIQEAMDRAKKEILLYHLFISIPTGATEEQVRQATEKAGQLYTQLENGADFQRLAVLHSNDPEVVRNKGRVGYVTAFVLPYDIENIVYALPESGVSKPYRSNIGIHIFKNGGERPVTGQWKVAHILLTFPPDADKAQEEEVRQLADSLYAELGKGADFKDLAFRYSKDNITYLSGGELSDFGIGNYDPVFEEAARSLSQDGLFSKPVLTSYGYHIIRRLALLPLEADVRNPAHLETFRQRVKDDDRSNRAKQRFFQKVLKETGYQKSPFSAELFNRLTESILKGAEADLPAPLTKTTPLFTLRPDKTYRLVEWITYLQSIKDNAGMYAGKDPKALFDSYVENEVMNYYREHLDRYNKDFATQLTEFRDGNLLFEIMQKKIWDVAAGDTAGLRKYYAANPARYWWGASADVVIFTTSDESHADALRQAIKQEGFDWRRWVESYNGTIQADSGRFELDQLPVSDGASLQAGMITSPMRNDIDNNVIFCLVQRMYPEKEQRNFYDARGFVINDYQNYLEDQWIKALKKKYPVKINETVVASLPKEPVK